MMKLPRTYPLSSKPTAAQLEADPLGPGPHNPMFGMFGAEIVLEGVGGPCTLGLSEEEAALRQKEWDEQSSLAC
jgi:hypothetical protein